MKKKNALLVAMQSKDTVTHNEALSNSSTGTALLDFFGKAGALRSQSDTDVTDLFSKAYNEDKTLALKVLFYSGDVRGGQGERRLFRVVYNWLAKNDKTVAKKLLPLVPVYRRYDDILESLENTPLEQDALKFMAAQLKADKDSDRPTLAAKWAPSEQASSEVTRRLAGKLTKAMKLTPKNYRHLLSGLRAKINVVERLMCENDWSKIDFGAVPSRAALIYKSAFNKHVPDKYSKFLTKVEKGEEKINSSTLYPYDLVREVMDKSGNDLRTIDAQWNALPDFLAENPHNGIVLADVSGSMDSSGYYGGKTSNVRPIDVSVSLAIYFAERNVGAFKDNFLIFGGESKLITLGAGSLKDKVRKVLGSRPCPNTNLQRAFDAILDKAVENNVPESEMPKVVYVISDMQFDQACSDNSKTNLDRLKERYKVAGYKMPNIVFWCVNAYSDTPVTVNDRGVCLVSGCSPAVFKTVLTGKIVTPWDVMLNTVNVERYKPVTA